MAVTYTKRLDVLAIDHGSADPGGSGDYTSSSFTTAAGTVLAAIICYDNQGGDISGAIPTPTTSGLTWVKLKGQYGSGAYTSHAEIWVADNASSGSKTIAQAGTGAWDTGVNCISLVILEFTGAAAVASQNGATAGTYSASGSGRDPGAQSTTLSGAPATSSYVVAAVAADGACGTGITVGAGWTEEADHPGNISVGPYLGSQVQTRTASTSTTVAWADLSTDSFVFDFILVAAEIKEASAGAITGTVAVTLASFVPAASGSRSLPTITGTVAVTLGVFTPAASGTRSLPAITGTVAVTLGSFTPTASGGIGFNGTAASTLGSFVAAASGSRSIPNVTGTVAVTLASFTPAASGTSTPPAITGTVAVTLASFTGVASGVFGAVLYPASASSRKLLDQNGNIYLLKTMSAWGMYQLSNADITTALEGCAGLGFNAVTIVCCGNEYGTGWERYTNIDGDPFFATTAGGTTPSTAFASELGKAWETIDFIMLEATRLELTVVMSFYTGNGTVGISADIISAGTTNAYNFGVDIATRYDAYRNIVWHFGADEAFNYPAGPSEEIDALFHGITDTETVPKLRCAEAQNGITSYSQFISQAYVWLDLTMNAVYSYGDSAVDQFDGVWTESGATTYPVWDCEPPYVSSPHYSGNAPQQLRERNYSTLIRGGCGINWGNEDFWPFDGQKLFTGGLTWEQTLTQTETLEASYCWTIADTYIADATWAPTSSFVTTGVGSGDTKAAAGASNSVALAYFPDNRTVQVDTTIIAGSANVRLRWFDPVANSYSTIAASEAQQTGRSVTLPAARGDGTRDFVLVVEALNDVTGTVAVTLGTFGPTASGTVTAPTRTGTVAVTLNVFTPAASGTYTPPAISGTVAVTLGSFTPAASGTFTTATRTGTVAVTLAEFTPAASGTYTPPAISGTVAVTLAAFTASALGAFTPAGSGSAAVTLDPFTATATGTSTPPAITGTCAVTLGLFVCAAVGIATGLIITPVITGLRTSSTTDVGRSTATLDQERTTS